MSSELFTERFREQFALKVTRYLDLNGLSHKAILALNNTPSRTDVETLRDGDVIAQFLPPNVTSLIQHVDQSANETFKRYYRKLMLQSILSPTSDTNLMDKLKSINIKVAIF